MCRCYQRHARFGTLKLLSSTILVLMLSVEQIIQEALSLPSDLRIRLVEELLASLEVSVDENTQTAWLTEAKRRRDEIRSAIVQTIPGEEALAQIRQILS